jgi:hypothetical protein
MHLSYVLMFEGQTTNLILAICALDFQMGNLTSICIFCFQNTFNHLINGQFG